MESFQSLEYVHASNIYMPTLDATMNLHPDFYQRSNASGPRKATQPSLYTIGLGCTGGESTLGTLCELSNR